MKNFFLILWKWIKRLVLAFFALSILSVIVYRWVPVPVTPLMLIRCVQQKFAGEPMKLDKKWVSFDNISPN
ncbi:MAG TPA: monofunctional biosynthetic peptidoglycan transglycosylase, partial [Bacteroidia bacterium]|nr:monofunctional biosynthetic peptidoglycan transglycosylase [Bacteroidia bacterium]